MIEQDHCVWERSLNPSSTASTVDFGLIPLHPTTTTTATRRPNSLATTDNHPHTPLPSLEGCGPIQNDSTGRDRRGTQGGTHEMGGPHGASQKAATTFVVADFPSPISPLTTLLPNASTVNHTRTPRPPLATNDHLADPTTTRKAQRPRVWPNDAM